MRRGHETRLVGRWRKVHAALEHRVEKAPERLLVALHDLGVGRRRRGTKIQTEHSAHGLGRKRNAVLACGRCHTLAEGARRRGKAPVKARRLESPEGRKSRSYGERVARERTGLVNGPQGRDFPHDVAAATECSQGHPPADYRSEEHTSE